MNIGFIQKRKYKNGNPSFGLSELCSTSIATVLGATILTPVIKPKLGKYPLLINWGLSSIPWLSNYVFSFITKGKPAPYVLNLPVSVNRAVDKALTLEHFEWNEVPTIPWTYSKDKALEWLYEDPKAMVFCRTLSKSCQGRGIILATTPEEVVDAPLYTLRVPKKWEYRVHVVCGDIIKVQQKKKLSSEQLKERGIEDHTNGLIRSYNNGYIFSTSLTHSEGSEVYRDLCEIAKKAIDALGLEFGAVDLLVTNKGKVLALEVNTAPGIEGSTKSDYINKFKQIFGI